MSVPFEIGASKLSLSPQAAARLREYRDSPINHFPGQWDAYDRELVRIGLAQCVSVDHIQLTEAGRIGVFT